MTKNKPSINLCVLCQENIVIINKDKFERGEIICEKCIKRLKEEAKLDTIEKDKPNWSC